VCCHIYAATGSAAAVSAAAVLAFLPFLVAGLLAAPFLPAALRFLLLAAFLGVDFFVLLARRLVALFLPPFDAAFFEGARFLVVVVVAVAVSSSAAAAVVVAAFLLARLRVPAVLGALLALRPLSVSLND